MTSNASAQPGIDIRRYWDVLVSRWRMVALISVLGVVAAAAYLVVVPTVYTSSTTVSVYPLTTERYAANRNISNLLDMDAEAVMASSFKVAEVATEAAGDPWTAAVLRANTTATVGAGNTTMTIRVEAPSEEMARAGAGAMADAYLQLRSDQAADSIDSVVEGDRERINEHRQQLTDALERLAAASPGSTEAAEAAADQQILNLQISSLLTRISSLEGIDTTGGIVLNPASMTQVGVKPGRSTTLMTGLAAGLLMGVIAAFVTHSRRKFVRSENDLSRSLEVETLGRLPSVQDEGEALAMAAQHLLRQVSLYEAKTVAIVIDAGLPGSTELVDRLAGEMGDFEHPVVVAEKPGAAGRPPSRIVLMLIPVAPEASQSERLHALRVSDVAVLVAGVGATRLRDVRALVRESDGMGTPVIGVLLVSSKARKTKR